MSLINDALKRANKSLGEKKGNPPPSIDIHPIDSGQSKTPWSQPWIPVILLAILLAAGWFFWKFWNARQSAQTSVRTSNQVASLSIPTTPTNRVTARSLPTTQAPAPPKVSNQTSPIPQRPTLSNHVAAAIRQAAVQPDPIKALPLEPVDLESLKLQGIYFRLKNPSAMINGRHVYVGNSVEGARVVTIERQSVTLEKSGTRHTLWLQ